MYKNQSFTLGPQIDYVDKVVSEGRFSNRSEYLRHLVRQDEQREKQQASYLDYIIKKSIHTANNSSFTPILPEELGALFREKLQY